MIVSGIQRRESANHIHVSILPQTPLPSRLPHNTELTSMCYTVGPCRLSILNIAPPGWFWSTQVVLRDSPWPGTAEVPGSLSYSSRHAFLQLQRTAGRQMKGTFRVKREILVFSVQLALWFENEGPLLFLPGSTSEQLCDPRQVIWLFRAHFSVQWRS